MSEASEHPSLTRKKPPIKEVLGNANAEVKALRHRALELQAVSEEMKQVGTGVLNNLAELDALSVLERLEQALVDWSAQAKTVERLVPFLEKLSANVELEREVLEKAKSALEAL